MKTEPNLNNDYISGLLRKTWAIITHLQKRGNGKTWLMFHGLRAWQKTQAYAPIVVTRDVRESVITCDAAGERLVDAVTLDDAEGLAGLNGPLILTHNATARILTDLAELIEAQQKEGSILREQISVLTARLEREEREHRATRGALAKAMLAGKQWDPPPKARGVPVDHLADELSFAQESIIGINARLARLEEDVRRLRGGGGGEGPLV